MKNSEISTLLIHEALTYYSNIGYISTSTPIIVESSTSKETKPEFVDDLYHDNDHVYVGSAEQGFIQLYNSGVLNDNGSYMSISPCFRKESILNKTNYLMFLKIELMIITDTPGIDFDKILNDAFGFFKTKANVMSLKMDTISKSQTDLTLNGIEIGSYGIRTFNDNKKYIYGTGLAEPRFSYALSLT